MPDDAFPLGNLKDVILVELWFGNHLVLSVAPMNCRAADHVAFAGTKMKDVGLLAPKRISGDGLLDLHPGPFENDRRPNRGNTVGSIRQAKSDPLIRFRQDISKYVQRLFRRRPHFVGNDQQVHSSISIQIGRDDISGILFERDSHQITNLEEGTARTIESLSLNATKCRHKIINDKSYFLIVRITFY